MLISSVFYGFSVSVTPFITKVNLVFLTYSILLGVAGSFLATLSIITQQEYFSKYFGFAIGVRFSANSLGAMVISFALPITFAELGYKVTFLCLLVFAPLILCYGFVARHQAVKDTDINRSKKSIIDIYREILQDKSFTVCLVGSALYFSTCIIPMVFMVSTQIIVVKLPSVVARNAGRDSETTGAYQQRVQVHLLPFVFPTLLVYH